MRVTKSYSANTKSTKPLRPTVSVGVPAYNEEGNIGQLLKSILRQKPTHFSLEKIYVVCDGCTDLTVPIVRKLAQKHPEITLIERASRAGKADALNLIYDRHQSDYLLTIDADLALVKTDDLALLVAAMEANPHLNVAGPRHVPVPQMTLWGKFAYNSYLSFEAAFLQWHEGNNFYGLMSVHLIRRALTKSFHYPAKTVADQCYLYAKSTRGNPQGFKLVQEARVWFRPVSTFHDWRLLGVRSVAGDKADVIKYFPEMTQEFALPRRLKYKALAWWLVKSPFYTLGSIGMNVLIRHVPYKKMSLKQGMWETTLSAKTAIALD